MRSPDHDEVWETGVSNTTFLPLLLININLVLSRNINAFALILVTVVSCTFIILDVAFIRILIVVPRFAHFFEPRIHKWIQDSVFHYQRKAYEAHAERAWVRLKNEIPTTENLRKMADLPLSLRPNKELTEFRNCRKRSCSCLTRDE